VPLENGLHPQQQFARFERLGQIVINAGGQTGNPVFGV
jgi:hypothetical protein